MDLSHAMNELTVKIASRCLISQEVRDQVDTGFADAYHDLQNGINTLGIFSPQASHCKAHRTRDRARQKVAELFSQVITGTPAFRSPSQTISCRPSCTPDTRTAARWSDDEITGILLTVLFAGQHTSAVLATWTALELI